MKKRVIFIFFLFLIQLNLYSQSLIGKIIDSNNKPIAGVNVINVSKGKHTHSAENGSFSLESVDLGDSIKFSHIGYIEQSITVINLTTPQVIVLSIKPISLDEITISPRVDALSMISNIDIQTNPVNSSQDILRQVPGLFIGQHAGGGKAEQIFLRGFDIDHGTDVAIAADGIPVNMVSHAHGQGYADLHFIIPETIETIDFGKGPYYAEIGNFNTAGYVNFNTKRSLENNLFKLEKGQFNTNRMLGMFSIVNNEKNQSYIASEYLSTDGPFESDQNFNRINLFGKFNSTISPTDNVSIIFSHFTSKWDASGQIPQRAIDNGLISRFGAIDDTEGGNTSRTNLIIDHDKIIDENSYITSKVFFSNYDFNLFSNFTFFLNDSINGDQIRQKEKRFIYGLKSEYNRSFSGNFLKGSFQVGLTVRNDQSIDNELSQTLNRKETLSVISKGDINETNYGTYANLNFNFSKWTINPAIRFDFFEFQYNDALLSTYKTQNSSNAIISPKLNILYNYSRNLQLYLKTGKGFHSNDTRVVVAQNGHRTLPAAIGYDAGVLWKPFPRVLLNTAYWFLFLEQEFVYVGDAGIVEPSNRTRRQGLDISIRYQPLNWLFWNFDTNYTYARTFDEEPGQAFIPLAPDFTLVNGITLIHNSGIYGAINTRFMKDRPANEDNSIVALGYTVVDLNLGYSLKNIDFGIQIQNLFNTEWNETQFATESRLKSEPVSVEEIHLTPGTPFFLKGSIQFKF